jgi:hypothetical protein
MSTTKNYKTDGTPVLSTTAPGSSSIPGELFVDDTGTIDYTLTTTDNTAGKFVIADGIGGELQMLPDNYDIGVTLSQSVDVNIDGDNYKLCDLLRLLLNAYLPYKVEGEKVVLKKVSEVLKNADNSIPK